MLTAARPVDRPGGGLRQAEQRAEGRFNTLQQVARLSGTLYTTVLCRAMQVRSTSSIGLPHQSLEKISISEKPA